MEVLDFLSFVGPEVIVVFAVIIGFSVFMIWRIHRHYGRKDLAPKPCIGCGFMITEAVCPYCGKDQTPNILGFP
jgi:hypothetical protein